MDLSTSSLLRSEYPLAPTLVMMATYEVSAEHGSNLIHLELLGMKLCFYCETIACRITMGVSFIAGCPDLNKHGLFKRFTRGSDLLTYNNGILTSTVAKVLDLNKPHASCKPFCKLQRISESDTKVNLHLKVNGLV
jgi:hypothetical protein